MKYLLALSFVLLGSAIYAQPKDPGADYKYVLRIQRGIESEIGFYLDEPKTGDLKKVHRESTGYLLLSESNPQHEGLVIRSEKIKKAVGELERKNYKPYIPRMVTKNIRYHYFYIDEFSND